MELRELVTHPRFVRLERLSEREELNLGGGQWYRVTWRNHDDGESFLQGKIDAVVARALQKLEWQSKVEAHR